MDEFQPLPFLPGNAQYNPYRWDFEILDGMLKVKDFRDDTLQVEYLYTQDKIRQLNLYTKIKTIDSLSLY